MSQDIKNFHKVANRLINEPFIVNKTVDYTMDDKKSKPKYNFTPVHHSRKYTDLSIHRDVLNGPDDGKRRWKDCKIPSPQYEDHPKIKWTKPLF